MNYSNNDALLRRRRLAAIAKPKRRVFFSFHYTQDDVFKVNNIRNIGALDGNKIASDNDWEEVKRKGDADIKKWIDEQMAGRTCLIVCIGEYTSKRRYVKYEIESAWNRGMGVLGIYLHDMSSITGYWCPEGANPFCSFEIFDEDTRKFYPMENIVKDKRPNSYDTQKDIITNLSSWIEDAITIRNRFPRSICRKDGAERMYGESTSKMDS